jgi:hypothetical protein
MTFRPHPGLGPGRPAASTSYGEDWEDQGRSHLADAALLLSILIKDEGITNPEITYPHVVVTLHQDTGAWSQKGWSGSRVPR